MSKGVQVGWSVQPPLIIGGAVVAVVALRIEGSEALMGVPQARELALGIIEAAVKADMAAARAAQPTREVGLLNGLPV